MGAAEVSAFLTDLAVNGHVAASTQNQALNALVFLYTQVLEVDLGRLDAVRARRPKYLPTVLAPEEVAQVLAAVTGARGAFQLMAKLLYGAGLRRQECLELRVHDLDVQRGQIIVRHGKGAKDRVVMLPQSVRADLNRHLDWRRALHDSDLARGVARGPAGRPGPEVPPAPPWNLAGNSCLRRPSCPAIRKPATWAGITSMPAPWPAPSPWPPGRPVSGAAYSKMKIQDFSPPSSLTVAALASWHVFRGRNQSENSCRPRADSLPA